MLEPGLLDLLALDRALPRVEVRGTELGRAIKSAKDKTERRITNAAKQLADLEISEGQIREMVEARIASRLIDGA